MHSTSAYECIFLSLHSIYLYHSMVCTRLSILWGALCCLLGLPAVSYLHMCSSVSLLPNHLLLPHIAPSFRLHPPSLSLRPSHFALVSSRTAHRMQCLPPWFASMSLCCVVASKPLGINNLDWQKRGEGERDGVCPICIVVRIGNYINMGRYTASLFIGSARVVSQSIDLPLSSARLAPLTASSTQSEGCMCVLPLPSQRRASRSASIPPNGPT